MGSVSIQLSNIKDVEESEFTYEIAGEASLFDMLNTWGAQHAPSLRERLFDPESGGIATTILILKNGRSVKSEDPKTTMVSPGDVLMIMPILVGG